MQLRHVVPVLGLVALSATAASAQEIAKGVNLGAWVDTQYATGTDDTKNSAATTDFVVDGDIKVGWTISDRANAVINVRNFKADGDGSGKATINVAEMYGTVKATEQLSISAGKTYGPIGYYSAEPTGLLTATPALTTSYYGAWPTGAWATYAPSEQFNATFFVADGFAGNSGTNGKSTNSPNAVSYALDFVYNPTSEISLNLEGYVDPKAGGTKTSSSGKVDDGKIYQIDFNGQYKIEKLTAAAEVVYNVVEFGNSNGVKVDDKTSIAWAAFATYALPVQVFPMAVTAQLSQDIQGESAQDGGEKTATKGQLALLTNPIGERNFGLNFEVFTVNNKYATTKSTGKAADDVNSYGLGIEGLFILP